MKKYSIFHIPVLAFYSKELYKDVGSNWRGVAFGYLLLLLVVCSALRMVAVHRWVSDYIDTETPPLVEQVPTITISDGQVSIDRPEPHYIKLPDSNEVIAVIDTTGTIQSLDDTDAKVLLTKTQVVWRKSETETESMDLSKVKHFVLSEDIITGWLNSFKKYFAFVLFPIFLVGSYIFRIIQALIYGAIGLLFAAWSNVKLQYAASVRLAVVAVTPCIIARTILGLASVHLPWAWFWFFLAAMGYLLFGVKANIEPQQPWPLQAGAPPQGTEQSQQPPY